ncbi:unnamed protein product (mitochondrion) [Musa acuminata var. zebrina]
MARKGNPISVISWKIASGSSCLTWSHYISHCNMDIFRYLVRLFLSVVFLQLGILLIVIVICDGNDSGSEQETDASVGAQESCIGVRPKGEANCNAGPSSRKEEKDLDLNVTPHPRVAIQSLMNDLMDADKKMDQLMR